MPWSHVTDYFAALFPLGSVAVAAALGLDERDISRRVVEAVNYLRRLRREKR
jgi:hypothetical protein